MKLRLGSFGLQLCALLCLPLSSAALATPPSVILITLDGVRWQEVFDGVDPEISTELPAHQPLFTRAWSQRPDLLIGTPNDGTSMKVSNPFRVSLPAYQSIFAGRDTGCRNNGCARIPLETFPEALVKTGIPRAQVAAFSSWDKIGLAIESVAGTIFSDIGQSGSPWGGARWDADTFEAGIKYLETQRPRFLYLSLNDTDEYAHRGDYRGYTGAMQEDDARIQRLADILAAMGDYGRSAHLIVTTDHGRGSRGNWRNHGDWVQGADQIWMTASGPFFKNPPAPWAGKRQWEHADLRPLIEEILL